jgi:hypothetical protein
MLLFLRIKQPYQTPWYNFKKNEVYLLDKQMAIGVPKYVLDNIKKYTELIPIDQLIKPYDHQKDKGKQILLVRSGGFGDIIALSSLCSILSYVHFATCSENNSLIKVFTNQDIDIRDLAKPIFSNWNMSLKLHIQNNWRFIDITNLIENGKDKNWYEIFFESVNAEFMPELGRPQIYFSDLANVQDYILLCPRASANIRSMSIKPIIESLNTNKPICVHESVLTEEDKLIAKNKGVTILKARSFEQYLNDIEQAEMVISVDTFAIHYREAIQRPAIGIYSSFDKDCRTKYYKYTNSINITSPCQLQPCYKHQKEKDEVCAMAIKGSQIAPCLDENYNKSLIEQLTYHFDKLIQ